MGPRWICRLYVLHDTGGESENVLEVLPQTHLVYQGLIPWAWIEASTKGAVLLFVASEAEYQAKRLGASNFVGGISGGMVGGLAQAYATMGFCTCMKTVEITKHKVAAQGMKPPGTIETFMNIYRTEGIRGINRGVNAVAVRQVTNWGSRFGLSRVAETGIRKVTDKEHGEKLGAFEKILASGLGGGLSAWNQPIEVIRVELQSKTEDPNRPKKMNVFSAAKYIYQSNGVKGLYRGVTPRIGLGVWQSKSGIPDLVRRTRPDVTSSDLHGRPWRSCQGSGGEAHRRGCDGKALNWVGYPYPHASRLAGYGQRAACTCLSTRLIWLLHRGMRTGV